MSGRSAGPPLPRNVSSQGSRVRIVAPFAAFKPAFISRRPYLAVAALCCAAGLTALPVLRPAWAQECAAGANPPDAAGTSALYGELAESVSAEPLSVDITARAIGGSCTWVYEVKVLTAKGSVALLDFDLVDLGLRHVEGAADDPEIAKLYERLNSRDKAGNADEDHPAGTGDDDGPDSGGNGDSGGGDDSGGSEGGSSGGGGSGSGGSDGGSEGGSGGDGSGSGGSGGGGEGGEGGGDD